MAQSMTQSKELIFKALHHETCNVQARMRQDDVAGALGHALARMSAARATSALLVPRIRDPLHLAMPCSRLNFRPLTRS